VLDRHGHSACADIEIHGDGAGIAYADRMRAVLRIGSAGADEGVGEGPAATGKGDGPFGISRLGAGFKIFKKALDSGCPLRRGSFREGCLPVQVFGAGDKKEGDYQGDQESTFVLHNR
jgi:hypothetical protein